ncbi:Spo0B C-terminal domain-containing protein [Salibacterium halotolerans]|uniref:Stage 0 sporulation protein B (Sporulation initiation phosphotransferase) n=1 Tax=Salibacterium halotolerans TaxID=1884432 RepID=A0A1I5UFY5_9BACI|nr:Spo0B C-terminal domain-containing protein [Salibacterium halotolerans]SFP94194.1 stage 0 sporulation protein B (sporulation initiation phosphotransferase) [Salibacterium halotolerans]
MDERRQLDILRHARHDWVNIIQIIKGNLSLNRTDRVEEILNETIQRSEHASRLTRLQVPKTALFLLSFNWEPHRFSLDMEVAGEARNCSDLEECWHEIISSFTRELDAAACPGRDNHLLITIHTEQDPYIEFDFQGSMDHSTDLGNWLSMYAETGRCRIDHVIWNEKELVFVLKSK